MDPAPPSPAPVSPGPSSGDDAILDYARPAAPRPLMSARLTGVMGVIVLEIYLLLLLVVPRFEALFRDYGARLPAETVLLLNLSRATVMMPLVVALAMIPLVILPPILYSAMRPWPPRRRWTTPAVALLGMVLFATILIGALVLLIRPMILVLNSISGP